MELKARDPDPERSLVACEALAAEDRGVLIQRDTYFHAPRGRLKLREEESAVSHLIAYERPDRPGQRESSYWIVNVERPNELLVALSSVLGVKVVIAKERRLFLWDGVRIHLDQVDGLGNFIEFEAISPGGSDLSHEEAQVATLRQAFGVEDSNLISGSYCDPALAGNGPVLSR